MKSFLLLQLLLLSSAGRARAQAKPNEVVHCAPDSVVARMRTLLSGLRFTSDSSTLEFVPDSAGRSDLGMKARIIKDQRTCKRAHETFLGAWNESVTDANLVAVAQI